MYQGIVPFYEHGRIIRRFSSGAAGILLRFITLNISDIIW
jgi:hypothetical protein